jgi:hypothetical protein
MTSSDIATWKSVTSITFNGQTLASPYACTPTDTSVKCKLVWGTGGSDSTDVDCVCAMDGTSSGYWGSVAGTSDYFYYGEAIRNVLEASSCHTLDRENLRAQRDPWGITKSSGQWRYAAQRQFNVTYWPWIQEKSVRDWVSTIFSDSQLNLSRNPALIATWTVQISILVISLIYLF